MPLANLVDGARAVSISALAALDEPTLSGLLAAASAQVRQITNRDLSFQAISERFNGGDHRISDPMRLREYPVHRISRLATNPVRALLVQNDGSTCQRATVETLEDGTGVQLQYQINGAALATQSFLYATYATLGTLATAITAFGNGFTASTPTSITNIDVTKVASADLWAMQGAVTCIGGGAYMTVYAEDISPYNFGPYGNDDECFGYQGYGWRVGGDTGEVYGGMPRGNLNIRVDYTAGYRQIPDSIQHATLLIAKFLNDSGKVNHVLKEVRLGRASQIMADSVTIPPAAYSILRQYTAHDKVISRG